MAAATLPAATRDLASVLAPRSSTSAAELRGSDPLLATCQIVGEALAIAVKSGPGSPEGETARDRLGDIARASGMHIRRVALRGDWRKHDNGPLLGYVEEDARPVALIPTSARSYALHDPAGDDVPITAAVAATISPFAYTFYRRFGDHPLTAREVVTFGRRGGARDVATVVLAVCAVGLLGVLAPLAVGVLFDLIIPGSRQALLFQLAAGLVIGALASAPWATSPASSQGRCCSSSTASRSFGSPGPRAASSPPGRSGSPSNGAWPTECAGSGTRWRRSTPPFRSSRRW